MSEPDWDAIAGAGAEVVQLDDEAYRRILDRAAELDDKPSEGGVVVKLSEVLQNLQRYAEAQVLGYTVHRDLRELPSESLYRQWEAGDDIHLSVTFRLPPEFRS